MRVIGLTGSIATGKSTASAILRDLGAPVVDADRVAREVCAPGGATVREIGRQLGDAFVLPDGSLNRAQLARVVFGDAALRERLNAIVHPRVRRRMLQTLERLATEGARVAVMDIPLLIESGGAYRTDEVWLVYVPEALQIERLMGRNQLTRAEALTRIRAQMPIEEKRRHADVVLDNTGDLDSLRQQVAREWKRVMDHA